MSKAPEKTPKERYNEVFKLGSRMVLSGAKNPDFQEGWRLNPATRFFYNEGEQGKARNEVYEPSYEKALQEWLIGAPFNSKWRWGQAKNPFSVVQLAKSIPNSTKHPFNKLVAEFRLWDKSDEKKKMEGDLARGEMRDTGAFVHKRLNCFLTTQMPRTPKSWSAIKWLMEHPTFVGDPADEEVRAGVTFGTEEYVKYLLSEFANLDPSDQDELQENWDKFIFYHPSEYKHKKPQRAPQSDELVSGYIEGFREAGWLGEDPHRDIPDSFPVRSRYVCLSMINGMLPFEQRRVTIFIGVFDGDEVIPLVDDDAKGEPSTTFRSFNDFRAKDEEDRPQISGRESFVDVLKLGWGIDRNEGSALIRKCKMKDGATARPFSSNMILWGNKNIVGSAEDFLRGSREAPQNIVFWDADVWFQDFHGYYTESGALYGLDGVAIGDALAQPISQGRTSTQEGRLPQSTLMRVNALNDHIDNILTEKNLTFDRELEVCFPELFLEISEDKGDALTLKQVWERYFAGDEMFGFPVNLMTDGTLRSSTIPTARCYWANPAIANLDYSGLIEYDKEGEEVPEEVEEEEEEGIEIEDIELFEDLSPLVFEVDDTGLATRVPPIVLDPKADVPAVSASQFAEIIGIMEDARADQAVGQLEFPDPPIEADLGDAPGTTPKAPTPKAPTPKAPVRQPSAFSFGRLVPTAPTSRSQAFRHLPPPPSKSASAPLERPKTPPAGVPRPEETTRQRAIVEGFREAPSSARPKRRPPPFRRATGAMRGQNPNRPGWRFPRKPYGSHRRLLPIVHISPEQERRIVSEVPRRDLVKAVLDWAKDENVRFRPSITREHKGTILNEIRTHNIPVEKVGGGYYGDGKPEENSIDFEKMKWGSFTKQAHREGFRDLTTFAKRVLENPEHYYDTTQRRARFYLNVINPPKQGGKCPITGKDECVCLTKQAFRNEHKALVELLRGTAHRLLKEAEEQNTELKLKGGKLGATGDPSLLESKQENPVVEEVIADPMDDKDIRRYYPNATIIKYSELPRYSSIDQLIPQERGVVFLLYQHSYNNGHWVLLSRYAPRTFEFFCSYGSKIDEPLTWTSQANREALGEGTPYLSNLLKGWNGKITYNKKQFQVKGSKVATCGAYCVMRTACLKNDGMNLTDFQSYMEQLKKETRLSYDEIVANFVSQR